MKILFIRKYNPFYESSASGNRYVGLLTKMISDGIKIDLLVTGGYNSLRELREYKKINKKGSFSQIYLVPTLNWNIWLRRINLYLLAKLIYIILNKKISKYYSQNYDFIWLTFEKSVLETFQHNYKYINGISLIELNEYNDVYRHTKSINRIQYKYAEEEDRVFIEALKNINVLLIMTRRLINHYKKYAHPKAIIFHLPMTVDFERFDKDRKIISNSEKYKIPYIAYTGAFSNEKDGIDVLIKAFNSIKEKYPLHSLLLAGFYHHDVEEQIKIIKEYDLKERVKYVGTLTKDEIPEFLLNAELLVLCRPDSYQASGGFPTKLGEYLASGRPVCVTKVGEIEDYLNDNESAFLAEAGNWQSFAEAMSRALSDQKNADRVGKNGKDVARENFSTDVQYKKLKALLFDLKPQKDV